MTRFAFVFLLCTAALAQEWKLQPSDLVRYETRRVTVKEGKESLGAGSFVSVYGHDLRAAGQYEPASPARADLPRIVGLFWPGEDGVTKRRVRLRNIIEVRCHVAHETKGDRIACTWNFKSFGKARNKDSYRLVGGKAHVTARIDKRRGVLDSIRVELSYQLRKLDPKPGEKPKTYALIDAISVKEITPHGYKGFRQQVNTAIDLGVRNLRTLQLEDGSFKPHGKWPVGSTALAVLTLSACGVPREDPAVAKALDWMIHEDPKRTYALGLSLMAFAEAYSLGLRKRRTQGMPDRARQWCNTVFNRLLAISLPPTRWVYKQHNARYIARPDASNTQYGVLGLRAGAKLGFKVPEKAWLGVIKAFARFRERPGRMGSVTLLYEGKGLSEAETFRVAPAGFRYHHRHQAWASMTSAGIACLNIARHELLLRKSPKLVEKQVEDMILGGWAWLDRHWGVDRNARHHGGRWLYYSLYSLERAGILNRVKRVGGRDWYFEGATQLLGRMKNRKADKKKKPKILEADAYWGSEKQHIAETCFALLFLKRATAPLSGSRK